MQTKPKKGSIISTYGEFESEKNNCQRKTIDKEKNIGGKEIDYELFR